jgi:tRNA G10  N-methylase Trm11
MENKKVFGSDVSERMVETSSSNLEKLKKYFSFEKHI